MPRRGLPGWQAFLTNNYELATEDPHRELWVDPRPNPPLLSRPETRPSWFDYMELGFGDKGARNVGFTLLELSTTVSVIAVLVTLAALGMGRAKSKGKDANCVSNLKQQALMLSDLLQTTGDYPFFIRPPTLADKYPEHRGAWYIAISAGKADGMTLTDPTNKRGIFMCPAATVPSDWVPGNGFQCYGYNSVGVLSSKGVGGFGLGGVIGGADGNLRPVKESEVVSPSAMLALGDGVIGSGTQYYPGKAALTRQVSPLNEPARSDLVSKRHGGSLNLAFADGHVEGRTLLRLFETTNHQDLSAWSRDNQPHHE